jgi:hypothetical protein
MPRELTQTEQAFLIKSLWSALSSPNWQKDDLIEMGKCLWAKTKLKDIPEKTFARLLPNLTMVANEFDRIMTIDAEKKVASQTEAKEPTPTQEPSNG